MSEFLKKYTQKLLTQTDSRLNLNETYIVIHNENKEAIKFMISDEEDLPEEICSVEAGLVNRQGHFINSVHIEVPSKEILDIFDFISDYYHQGIEHELKQRATIYKRLVQNTYQLLYKQDDMNDVTYSFSCTHLLCIKYKDNLRIEIPLEHLEQANHIGYVNISVEYRDDEINDSTISFLRVPYIKLMSCPLLHDFIHFPYAQNSQKGEEDKLEQKFLSEHFQHKLCDISSLAKSIELEDLLYSKNKSSKMKI